MIFSEPFQLHFPIIFITVDVITENSKHWWSWSLEQSLSHTVESCSTHTIQQYYFLLATTAVKAETWSSGELNKVQVIQKKSKDKQEEFLNLAKKRIETTAICSSFANPYVFLCVLHRPNLTELKFHYLESKQH